MAKQTAVARDTIQLSDPGVFTELLDREFKPRGDQQREAVEAAVRTLAEQALGNTVTMSDDAYASIEAIIAEIDQKLTAQINLILHHEDFQRLESAWRGLNHLVSNTETDAMLKIRFLDIGKTELRRTLRRFKGVAWDQSPLFKRLYEEEYGQLGGEPYGCLVADYYFDHTPADVELLGAMAKIASAAHAPLIAGAAPSTLQMESWQELANPRDLAKITGNLEHAAWNSLRANEDARYVGLCMPRFLGRLPYGAKTNPVDEFNFEEDTQGADHKNYVWSNAAYAMAVNINRSFKTYGWCTMIRGVESGGTVEGLPCHTFPPAEDVATPADAGDVMQALHARYLARLRDPTHHGESQVWQDVSQDLPSAPTQDPMAQWMREAGDKRGLDDLLMRPCRITDVLDGLAEARNAPVLAPAPFENVLHLFAPENLRTRNPSASPTDLPGLTRREHHSLSLDSAMPLPEGRADPPNDPPAGADR